MRFVPNPIHKPNAQINCHPHTHTQILTFNCWIAPLVRWRPAENLDKICDFVRAQGADVVCMQEVGGCVSMGLLGLLCMQEVGGCFDGLAGPIGQLLGRPVVSSDRAVW